MITSALGNRWVLGTAAATVFPTNGQGGSSTTNTASELASNVPLAIASATWTEATRTLTKTGLFAEYVFAAGDKVWISAGTGATVGGYLVASRTSANAIVLQQSIGAAADGQTDIAGILSPIFPAAPLVVIAGFEVTVVAAGDIEVADGRGTAISGLKVTLGASNPTGFYPLEAAWTGGNCGIKLAAGITATMFYRRLA